MRNLHYVNCNICNGDSTTLVAVQNHYKFVRCLNCGLVYMNPIPENEELNNIYDHYHQRNGKGADSWELMMKGNFKNTAKMIINKYPSGGRLLDIGCGYGHFLKIMSGYDWQVEGIDLSTNTVTHARQMGLNVSQATIEDISLPESSFQVITMFYVLEHVVNPSGTLKRAFNLLIPGGLVIIRIPHTTPLVSLLSIFRINNNLYDAPFHLYDYSPKVIELLLNKSGFFSIEVMPGEPTEPAPILERLVSLISGYIAKLLYKTTNKKVLLPGVSKTIIAYKPKEIRQE